MAQSFITDQGTLIIPGGYPSIRVQTAASGLATSGVIMLVGEADQGPDFTLETDLETTSAFGPDQLSSVVAKYKSGNLVDGFRAAAQASNDPQITGAPSRIILVKTNPSTKASATALTWGALTWTLADRSFGKLGNLISFTVTAATSEVVPTTGSFTWIPNAGTTAYNVRINGGAALTSGNLAANTSPAAFVAAIGGLAGITAIGGADRGILAAAAGTLAVVANPGGAGVTVVTVTRSINFDVIPTAGDTMIIPLGSVIAGAGSANVGAYVVTAATATVITAQKLSDAGAAAPVPGTITNPVNVAAAAVVATTDVQAKAPVTVSLAAANPVDGIGKSLEISELTTGTDLLSRSTFALGVLPVTWVSKAVCPQNLVCATEDRATYTGSRQVDNVLETLTAGGEIALLMSYKGTTATVTITATTFSTTVTGGTGAGFSINLRDYPTINDLVKFINAQTGYTAAVGTAVLGQIVLTTPGANIGQAALTALDQGTFGICSTQGVQNGRIKIDSFRFFNAINNNSVLLQTGTGLFPTQATAGVPQPTALTFLAGGAKGGTTAVNYNAAIDALQKARGNFVVPLISRDATLDIADGLTETTSTYTIDAANAYTNTHCLTMSTLKRRRNRQCFLSKEDTFLNQKLAAANIASFRAAMCFQDPKVVAASTGNITQFQPWITACVAAGMQAAGFRLAIVNKQLNISGLVNRAGDFNDKDDTAMEDALNNGLLPARRAVTGGFTWVSDQTTYGKDNNFVFNSIQAVYTADVIALTTAQQMEAQIVGQSVADISAPIALSMLEAIMGNFLRLKLIAPSDDAPKGFKNAAVAIIGGKALRVDVEIKLATAIYFVPISFLVSPVNQSAGSSSGPTR